jgi:general secretion pathway protein D
LEVSRNDLRNLGIEYPGNIGVSVARGEPVIEPRNGSSGTIPLNNLLNLSRGDIRVTSPELTLNMLESSGNTEMLANPRVRVRNREKATVTIGERVPVVTTTSINGVGTTESINYQDVGLKLEIEPIISLHDEIDIKVSMDVSNVIREEKTRTGLIAYVIGTRNIDTTLTARNNEMQIIGGLIRRLDFDRQSGLPWVSRIPILGQYFFGSKNRSNENSEIVLLIRPRIERNLELPASQISTFMSGTEARPGDESLQLRASEGVNVSAPSGGGAAGGATPPPPMEQPSNNNWQPLPPPTTGPAGAASVPATPSPGTLPASSSSTSVPGGGGR